MKKALLKTLSEYKKWGRVIKERGMKAEES
jgi:hypothetical protein